MKSELMSSKTKYESCFSFEGLLNTIWILLIFMSIPIAYILNISAICEFNLLRNGKCNSSTKILS